jgi:hypothetical protein
MTWLRWAGLLCAALAVLHVVIIFLGAPAYRYFGAGEELARRAEQGSAIPALVTGLIALVFAAWAAYAFSAAGLIGRLPLLRPGLLVIGAIFTLRGLALVPQLGWWVAGNPNESAFRNLIFSAVALLIGLIYLMGARAVWSNLAPRP